MYAPRPRISVLQNAPPLPILVRCKTLEEGQIVYQLQGFISTCSAADLEATNLRKTLLAATKQLPFLTERKKWYPVSYGRDERSGKEIRALYDEHT
jgi:Mlc titration factor MtfA (ptsG expression regulator)